MLSFTVCGESLLCVSTGLMDGGGKKKRRHAEEGIRVESRSLLIFISTSVCGVSLSTSIQQNTERHIIPRFSVQLRLTSISLISIHRLIWQHVSKLIGLLFGALSFRSASCKYATAWGGGGGFEWNAGGQHTFVVVLQQFTRQGTARFTGTESCN